MCQERVPKTFYVSFSCLHRCFQTVCSEFVIMEFLMGTSWPYDQFICLTNCHFLLFRVRFTVTWHLIGQWLTTLSLVSIRGVFWQFKYSCCFCLYRIGTTKKLVFFDSHTHTIRHEAPGEQIEQIFRNMASWLIRWDEPWPFCGH